MDTYVGTLSYKAPEILKNIHKVYKKQVDIWSMGIVLYFWYVHTDSGILCSVTGR
jgi:serine/threonine protein kinase